MRYIFVSNIHICLTFEMGMSGIWGWKMMKMLWDRKCDPKRCSSACDIVTGGVNTRLVILPTLSPYTYVTAPIILCRFCSSKGKLWISQYLPRLGGARIHYIQQHIWQILKLKAAQCITHGYCKFQFSRRETRNVKYLRDTWGTCDMWGIGWGEQTCYALWRVTWAQGRACKMSIPLHYLCTVQHTNVHSTQCILHAWCLLHIVVLHYSVLPLREAII